MLSRVAESLYWISRYIERTDGMLRMLKTNYASSQDVGASFNWTPVLRIYCGPDCKEFSDVGNKSRPVLEYMVTDRSNPNSVINMITHVRQNARSVQDYITIDVWQCLNEYYHTVTDPRLNQNLKKDDPISVLDILIKQGMLFYGTTEITMARSEGTSFMRIGKYLERSIQSVNVLAVKFGSASTNPELMYNTSYWKHLMLSIGGHELYLKTYRNGFFAENVLEQVVLNNEFPRSVIYSLDQLIKYFGRIPGGADKHPGSIGFLIGRLESKVKYTSLNGLKHAELHEYLSDIKSELYAIGNALHLTYFSPS
ncbi:alpha-E domain-containing protein [Pedobacter deserti]|uniref:alpha-E domain-containing protein n=1 Tax=Pedobacter deserti TaxID=2817382 RepID=UPI002109F071|nr:alpha-E domain-containing protein [Pedobacter sp. SYSU D00382]